MIYIEMYEHALLIIYYKYTIFSSCILLKLRQIAGVLLSSPNDSFICPL